MYLLKKVYYNGQRRADRTGTGTWGLFAERLAIDLRFNRAPLITTKKLNLKPLLTELSWFLLGETDTDWLHQRGVTLWDPWAKADGTIGPLYGYQWRRWGGDPELDQLKEAVRLIEADPTSRRILVSAWNVSDLNEMVLPPCPVMFQFYVANGELSCHVYQRSADVFLGLPFDIAQYGILTQLVAHQTGLRPGRLVFSFGDLHLYTNHEIQARAQLSREPKLSSGIIEFDPDASIDNFSPEKLTITGYDPYPAIHGKVSV